MGEQNLGSVLKRLEIDQSTGSLVCVGEDNAFARVYFVDGKPRAARCRDLQGREALMQLSATSLQSVKFHDGVNLIKSDVEDEGIGDFSAGDGDPAAAVVDSGSAAAVDVLAESDDAALGNQKLTAAHREIIVEELIEYVGPVAQMVVGGLGDNISMAEALKLLVLEIDDRELARQFVDKVKQRI